MADLKELKSLLKKMGSVLIAYSGGADSTFLLKIASGVLGAKVLAVTAVSETYPEEELRHARKIARSLGVRHFVIKTVELKDRRFLRNTTQRCYFCKRELFKKLKALAKKEGIAFVLDAGNFSDRLDFRPGNKAKNELGVRSPLAESGFTKEDIRRASRSLGLETWDKPSLACLASRIPYGEKISPELLARINKGERLLQESGFKQVRLRHYDHSCRIEVSTEDLPLAVKQRKKITTALKRLGYHYIALDLEGFRSGSMNEVIKR